jgi:tRNA-modifying protein YgfZ
VTDVDEKALPHELDWMRTAVHLAKGCYRGQETVAKVHNLGHPPRRLVALQLDGSDSVLPARGDVVRAGDDAVGVVLAAALHHEEGPIALALVRRSAPLDADLLVDTADGAIAAAQEVVVPPEAGATAAVPRLPRLGRRTATR